MSCDFLDLAVPGVRALTAYPPGKPIEELARELGLAESEIIKLASNENPLGPSPKAMAAIAESMSDLFRYPDGNGFFLKKALAEKLGVEQDQITLGNGSNEVLVLVAEAFLSPESSAVYSEFAFVVFSLAVRTAGAESLVVPAQDWGCDLNAMAEAIKENTRLVFLANPNNPTGTHFSKDKFVQFMNRVPERVLVVLDEAYFEYHADDSDLDGIALLQDYPNLVITRTFSKAFGLAGIRIGYSVSNPQVANILNRVRQPFNTSILSQAAAIACLDDKEYLKQSIALNKSGMRQLEAGFTKLGLDWIPSAGNFVTVDLGKDAMPVYQSLLSKGVIVRPVANYGMAHHLRISIGLPEENQRCLQALAEVLGQDGVSA